MLFWGLDGTGRTSVLRAIVEDARRGGWVAVRDEVAADVPLHQRLGIVLSTALDAIRATRPGLPALKRISAELGRTRSGHVAYAADAGWMLRLVADGLDDMRSGLCVVLDNVAPGAACDALLHEAVMVAKEGTALALVVAGSGPDVCTVAGLDCPQLVELHPADVEELLCAQAGGSIDPGWVSAASEATSANAQLLVHYARFLGTSALAAPSEAARDAAREHVAGIVGEDFGRRSRAAGLTQPDRRFLKALADLGGSAVPALAVAQRVGDVTPLRRSTAQTEARAASLAGHGLVVTSDRAELWINPPYLATFASVLD